MLNARKWEPYVRSLLRIVAGFTFSLHGAQKLLGMFGGVGGGATASPGSFLWYAGIIELGGGGLVLIGLLTRPVAFVVSGEMAVAYFMRHAQRSFWPILNGGELAAVYCFLFLYFAAAGPGPWSADRALRRE